MGVTLFAVHLGGWDSNPASVSKLSRLDRSFLAPHPRGSRASFRGNESHHMFAVSGLSLTFDTGGEFVGRADSEAVSLMTMADVGSMSPVSALF